MTDTPDTQAIRPCTRTKTAAYRRAAIQTLCHLVLLILLSSCAHGPRSTESPDFKEFIRANYHHDKLRSLERFLKIHKVHGVVATQELLQQGTDWRANGLPRYAFPPREHWSQMVATLDVLKNLLIPKIGPVKVVSGFRTAPYNLAAGGAPRSRHLTFSALDVVPVRNIDTRTLHRQLWAVFHEHGERVKLGLGIYSGNRFHIDTGGHRAW